jgi:hypothetical protein
MIELRWLVESGSKRLQYRDSYDPDTDGPYFSGAYSDWQDVPVVEEEVKSDE